MEFLEHRRLRERPFESSGDERCVLRHRAPRTQVTPPDSIEQRVNPRFQVNPDLLENAAHHFGTRFPTAGHAAGHLHMPEGIECRFEAAGGIHRKRNPRAKLALEFAWDQEYSEATPTALDGVVHGMNRHQTLTIA